MTKEDKDELIERIGKITPTYEDAQRSPYLAGKRDVCLAMILEITEYWYDKKYGEVSINE
nr:MAG: hypothetical protein [Microvirus Sku111]